MSALADVPAHFLDWLRTRDPSAHHGSFAPRQRLWRLPRRAADGQAQSQSDTRIDFVRDEVVDLELGDQSTTLQLTTRKGDRLAADRVVLALGHALPEEPEGLEHNRLGRGYAADPWSAGASPTWRSMIPIVLVGTGLTAVDLMSKPTRAATGAPSSLFRVTGFSPCRHQTSPGIPRPHIKISAEPGATAGACCGKSGSEVAACKAQGSDWRSVVDSIRPVTQTLWRSLGDSERAHGLCGTWHLGGDVHRHRVAPQIDEMLQAQRHSGRLVVVAGRVLGLADKGGTIEVSFRRRGGRRIRDGSGSAGHQLHRPCARRASRGHRVSYGP